MKRGGKFVFLLATNEPNVLGIYDFVNHEHLSNL